MVSCNTGEFDPIKGLLDMAERASGLSFFLKIYEDIYVSEAYPNFCKLIMKYCPEICSKEFGNGNEIHICDAGLWCITMPIVFDKKVYGYLSIGHRCLDKKESETKLELLFKEKKITEALNAELKACQKNIPTADKRQCEDMMVEYAQIIFSYLYSIYRTEKKIKELKKLSISLAHSFLTPIQAIVARTENLSYEVNEINKPYLNPDIILNINGILEEIIKLSYYAENLRDWMAEEKDLYKFQFREVSIYPILLDVIKLFRSEAHLRGIMINSPIPVGMPFPHLKISEPHMRKAFMNLINNAIKYSFEGNYEKMRHIDIICKEIGNYYCIEISNYGVGILQDEIEKVFEIGYRGKLAKDRNRFGSGLGLSVVKSIIEGHGGKVEIESRMAGELFDSTRLNPFKTKVRIYLPLILGSA